MKPSNKSALDGECLEVLEEQELLQVSGGDMPNLFDKIVQIVSEKWQEFENNILN